MNKIDLIIENGLILPINPQNQIIKNGFIVINKNKIIQIGSKKPTKYFSDNTIDANGGIIMPGLINAHTHIAMTYFRGLADDLALDKWLQEYIWPAESKYLSKDFVYQSSIHGCAELIRNGTTYFNDMYFWGNEIAQAAIKTGIKTTIGEGILNQPIGENKTPKDIINYVLNLIEKYKNNFDIDFSIAPHSIFTCSKDTLKLSANIAQKHNLPIHIHLSETKKEIDDCIKNYNKLPLEYLKECGILDNKVVAAHGTFLTDKELKLVSNNDFHVAVNTNCNLKLASGHTPINLFIKNNINFAISTDGVASNNNLDLFEELKTTSLVQKAINKDPKFLKASKLVKSITIDAAKALGKEEEIGSLEVGKIADIIILDTNRLENHPIYDPFSAIVYNLNSSNINTVISNGKLVMQNRKLTNIDESEIIQKAEDFKSQIEANN